MASHAHDQRDVVEFLQRPETHRGAPVERIDTHSAIVFLAASRALKLKRAIQFDYLDFSTPELRRAACEAEVRINRRAAPAIYRGVTAVTREASGELALNGSGPAEDWLVDMTRFDQDALFDRLAASGSLDLSFMRPLASAVAAFHAAAPHRADHGGLRGMTWVVDGNDHGFAEEGAGILDATLCHELTDLARQALSRHGRQLDARRSGGFVRQCHGDLHLGNIVLLNGVPTLFDAIEFNDEIACADVWYDVAFLLMDLWHRQLPRHANAVFNGYAAETGDFEGISLLPFFLSCRAAVRAKTSATAARVQTDATHARELESAARDYLTMAVDLLRPTPPRLIAIGGLSGSGKSTMALRLAPSVAAAPGALVLRSDEIRKALCGVASLDRLGAEAYTSEVTQQVYRALADRTAIALRSERTVIVDAVFARPADRAAIETVASLSSVPFAGFWLDAPGDVLLSRVAERRLDPSDADASVVRHQLATGTGSVSWRRVETGRLPADVLTDLLAGLSATSNHAAR